MYLSRQIVHCYWTGGPFRIGGDVWSKESYPRGHSVPYVSTKKGHENGMKPGIYVGSIEDDGVDVATNLLNKGMIVPDGAEEPRMNLLFEVEDWLHGDCNGIFGACRQDLYDTRIVVGVGNNWLAVRHLSRYAQGESPIEFKYFSPGDWFPTKETAVKWLVGDDSNKLRSKYPRVSSIEELG